MFFFFQAEDGIRDLVRSRGLGDVYKRQLPMCAPLSDGAAAAILCTEDGLRRIGANRSRCVPVSYTHLTLPTSDLV